MNTDKQKLFKPDFILIPYPLIDDRTLEPMDRMLYGLIYWYEHMKEGRCRASNQSFAYLLHTTPRAVQNSLTVLETKGYIERFYKDVAKRNRIGIHSKIAFKSLSPIGDRDEASEEVVTPERTVGDRHERTVGDQNKNIITITPNNTKSGEYATPSEKAVWFFDNITKLPLAPDVQEYLLKLVDRTNLGKSTVWYRVQEFVSYWTEKTPSGKKQRWQTEKTFEVDRRLNTWFLKNDKMAMRQAPRKGKGIINATPAK